MSEERLRTARKLIEQGRYDAAEHILRQIDHPTAQVWLEKLRTLEPKRERQTNWRLPILALAFAIGVVALVLALMFLPRFIALLQEKTNDAYLGDAHFGPEDERYYDLIHFCTMTVGTASILYDWVDSVTVMNIGAANNCLTQFDVETPAE
jgi:hypothetical protein